LNKTIAGYILKWMKGLTLHTQSNRGFNTLEFGIIVAIVMFIVTGVFDLYMLFKARSTISDTTEMVGDLVAALPPSSSSSTALNTQVMNSASEFIREIFPRAQLGCTGDFCYQIDLTLSGASLPPGSFTVTGSIEMPTLVLGGRKTLSARAMRRFESSYAPTTQLLELVDPNG
jgi:hypothetical protein